MGNDNTWILDLRLRKGKELMELIESLDLRLNDKQKELFKMQADDIVNDSIVTTLKETRLKKGE